MTDFHDKNVEKPYRRCQNFQNLVSLIQDNGFQRNNSLFQLLLDQRLSVPFLFQSTEDPSQLNSFANALMNVKVNIGDENIILSDDITLPRVAFISNRSRRERNPKIIELALNSTLVSGSSNVLKVRDLRTKRCYMHTRTAIWSAKDQSWTDEVFDLSERLEFLKKALLKLVSVLLSDMEFINHGLFFILEDSMI